MYEIFAAEKLGIWPDSEMWPIYDKCVRLGKGIEGFASGPQVLEVHTHTMHTHFFLESIKKLLPTILDIGTFKPQLHDPDQRVSSIHVGSSRGLVRLYGIQLEMGGTFCSCVPPFLCSPRPPKLPSLGSIWFHVVTCNIFLTYMH